MIRSIQIKIADVQNIYLLLTILTILAFSIQGFAQSGESCDGFCLLDNFDDKLNGSIRSQGAWQTNPAGALDGAFITDRPPSPFAGKALQVDPNGVQFRGNAYLPLENNKILDGSTGTLFFQIYTDDIDDSYSHFGLTDLQNPRLTDSGSGQVTLYTDFEMQFTLNQGVFSVNNGVTTVPLTNLSAESANLYNVWLIADNFSDTYEVYVQGGAHSDPTKGFYNTLGEFNFRNRQTSSDLQTVYSITSSDLIPQTKRYFDNIYIDPDNKNITNPIASNPHHSVFLEIADFESSGLGELNGYDGWSGSATVAIDPIDSTNKALQVIGASDISKVFDGVRDRGQATLFFRMMRRGFVDASAGLSDIEVPENYADYESQLNTQNNATLNIRDGNDFRAVDTFEENVWHCIWMLVDNSSDRYEAFVSVDSSAEPVRLEAPDQTDFSFRNGSSDALSTFYVKTGNSNGSFFVDDIYYSNDYGNLDLPVENICTSNPDPFTPKLLSDPIPEPIVSGGLDVVLQEFITVPPSSSNTPIARINFLDHANDDSGRLFVNDMRNSLYVIDANGELSEYLNVSSEFEDFIDSPRLGSGFGIFAFHPDFQMNGKFYTVHTEARDALLQKQPDFINDTTVAVHGVIVEWTATNPQSNTFIGTNRELMRVGFETYIHGIQQIGFDRNIQPGDGDYGLLYVAIGDGQANPNFTTIPQNLRFPHGKILRIDPSGTTSENNQYGIPSSNPFALSTDVLGEIWSYGLRNPHRFSWDSGGTNKMFIGQIGEKNIDAIYPGIAGANHGWNEREGAFLFKTDDSANVFSLAPDDSRFGYTYPVAQYDHDEGFAVVGGFVYRGAAIPALNGMYVFGDIVNGQIFYSHESKMIAGDRPSTIHELTLKNESGEVLSMRDFVGNSRVDLRLGQDAEGELYLLSKTNGKIWRVTPDADINYSPVLSRVDDQRNIVGEQISISINSVDQDDGDLFFSATGLPEGIEISQSGVLSGQVMTGGVFLVSITVADASGALDTERFNWVVDTPEDESFDAGTPDYFVAQLQNVLTELCIEVPDGSFNSGANAHSGECISNPENAAHQRLYFVAVDGIPDTYTLEFEHSGMCLSVPDGDTSNGVSLVQKKCEMNNSQYFQLGGPIDRRVLYTSSAGSNSVVDSHAHNEGDQSKWDDIIQWTDQNSDNQRWVLLNFEDPVLPDSPAATCNSLLVTVDLNHGDVATSGDDVILGTADDDVINALGGNDTICAGSGNDIVNAGDGADWVDGGSGDDNIDGGAGNDSLFGGIGNDTIDGGDGIDDINGGGGNDTIFTGPETMSGVAASATYRLTVDNNWSQSSYPIGYPDNAHFSWIGGGTHAPGTKFWSIGGTATSGLEIMAESGITTSFAAEIQSAGGAPLEWPHWFCTPTPPAITAINCGSSDVIFTVDDNRSALTLTSMLGPSPDWFVGISDYDLKPGGNWMQQANVQLQLLDAGTEDGTTPTTVNAATEPFQPISHLQYNSTTGNYTLTDNATVIGGFQVDLISINSNTAPTMVYPAATSTLVGPTESFSWNEGSSSVTNWRVKVGSTYRGTEFHNKVYGLNTSTTISGLPTDGSIIYVTLEYQLGSSSWLAKDLTYKASFINEPEMTVPEANTILPGDTSPFVWTADTDTISLLWLQVGTSYRGIDLHNQSYATASTVSVSSLPTNGSPVYATLWYQIAGSTDWFAIDYQYTTTQGTPVPDTPTPTSQAEFITQLQSLSTGKCIEIANQTTSSDANADTNSCIDNAAHQQLYFKQTTTDSNTYTIQFQHSDLCLTVPNSATNNGASLIQQNCIEDDLSQQFTLVDESNDKSRIALFTNTTTGKVIDSHAQTDDLIQWTDFGNNNQRWSVVNLVTNTDQNTAQPVTPVDLIAPTATISSPTNDHQSLGLSPTLTGTTNDNVGGSGVDRAAIVIWSVNDASFVTLDGTPGPWALIDTTLPVGNPQSANWTIDSSLPIGTYVLHVYPYDANGNFDVVNRVSRPFRVVDNSDAIAPTATITSPVSDHQSLGLSPTITGTIKDNNGGSGVDRAAVVIWSVNDTSFVTLNGTPGPWAAIDATLPSGNPQSANWTLNTSLPIGTYVLHVYPYDAAGNMDVANRVSRPIRIIDNSDAIAPNATITSPVSDHQSLGLAPTLTGTINDNVGGSGVDRAAIVIWSVNDASFVTLDGTPGPWALIDTTLPAGNPQSANWTINTSLPSGTYVLHVYPFDANGSFDVANRISRAFSVTN